MKPKAFVLQNKGMNRDLSISKVGESSAFENHNIRILARDHDTMFSVTNERGTKLVVIKGLESANLRITEDEELRITEDELYRIVDDGTAELGDIRGILIGWNVLNNHIILFTNEKTVDRIYRIDYEGDDFRGVLLFEGELGFKLNNPIESVVYHETEEIQKIYWVDGINVLRFMNFMAKPDEETGYLPWQTGDNEYDNTYFDSNRAVDFGVNVSISKDNSGNTRPNGVIQYLLTYYNKHGQESGYVWISDLVYLSPVASGGAADGTNNNSITLTISNLDTRFDHFRVYSVFRSALNGTTIGHIVFDGKTDEVSVTVVDNNSHLISVDASQLLYLGSKNAVASTLTHKDQTLFLGDLTSVDRDYDSIEDTLREYMLAENGNDPKWESACIKFVKDTEGIPNETSTGNYSYNSQLVYSSSKITSFKGGEKYRFGIVFHKDDGSLTDAFWIGDKVNHLYPEMTDTDVYRIIAKCTLPPEVVDMMKREGFRTAQLMIAEATYADRSVKAQGIVCPTVFNVWDRYMNRRYAASSWMMRPRNSECAWQHFSPIHNSNHSSGEIDCNYWETAISPKPYYVLDDYATNKHYDEEFDGKNEYDYALIVYRIFCDHEALYANKYYAGATVILAKALSGSFPVDYTFSDRALYSINALIDGNDPQTITYTDEGTNVQLQIQNFKFGGNNSDFLNVNSRKEFAYNYIMEEIHKNYDFFSVDQLPTLQTFRDIWCNVASDTDNTDKWWFFNNRLSSQSYASVNDVLSNNGSQSSSRWYPLGEESVAGSEDDYAPAYYKKHLVFLDENTVTLNSPEIEYEAISFDKVDGHNFRIVGIAKIDGRSSDYTVNATPGKLVGENLVKDNLVNTLASWPLWKEHTLDVKLTEDDDSNEARDVAEDPRDRSVNDYQWGGGYARYWLHMWNHSQYITGFTDEDKSDYSRLIRKVFANSRYSKKTNYGVFKLNSQTERWSCEPESIRIFNYTSSQYVGLTINGESKYYDAILNDSLSVPGNHKYPVLYTIGIPDPSKPLQVKEDSDIYLSDPVLITYSSSSHAVVTLPTSIVERGGRKYYEQTILPRSLDRETVTIAQASGSDTGALLPWIDNSSDTTYPYKDYSVKQDVLSVPTGVFGTDPEYVYIGEIYTDFQDDDKIRYGGITDAAIQNNRFLIAGPQYIVNDMTGNGSDVMIANQGDTYIQRWDCLKTKPYSSDCANNVIDITSVMLETHINIDGRTDLQRGTSYIASIDAEKFGSLNPVYSQNNNFITQHDLDEDFNLDAYHSSITWTLEKHDSEDVDAWSHITLANTLKLDGDKGSCRALRRLGNSIIAFQDKGISEILFNSRTQLSTQDGVPVEIANSGKVDGKRYITNKYGCTNKWSIVEGKAALYFVDNINKAFCAFNGSSIDNLSNRLGFGAWFREINNMEPWKPVEFNNLVSYYDKVHSDIYLIRNTEDNYPCLVYNENLGSFTSFFDYSTVLMMTNVDDRFVSYKNHHLWLQNEGLYGDFFGEKHGFSVQYRVTPEPYSDKIWTNVEYRADFYEVLDENGDAVVPEADLINGDTYLTLADTYKEHETLTTYKVWNEYQTTGNILLSENSSVLDPVRKKFRIWRLTIPRALKKETLKPSLDRIRNPWINIKFNKEAGDGKNLVQLHDFIIKYFE